MKHLGAVLQSFRDVGVTLRLSKCNFAKGRVKFIGHEIGSGTRIPLLDKIEAIKNIEEPKTKKALRSFLGCSAFYRGYVKNFSTIALPLTDLTKNNCPNTISFNDAQRKSFNDLKLTLCNFTSLHAPTYDRDFILRTDASERAIGAVLSQLDDEDHEFPVAFVSAKLTESQCLWPTIQKEAFSLIFALKKLDVYVFASTVEVFMDHNPLLYVFGCVPQCPRLSRWALALSRYNLHINHVSGRLNVVADFLSRY